ncbi:hypothetical protein HYQ46_009891 [Verticillium longisporum]|nr:hypothetical protein HYQ46_009891 [Verticillium longisporum]
MPPSCNVTLGNPYNPQALQAGGSAKTKRSGVDGSAANSITDELPLRASASANRHHGPRGTARVAQRGQDQ